ncbi:MAG: VOC family protein [bacterium]
MIAFSVLGIDHVEMFVPDRYEAAKWYHTILGLRILSDYEEWAGDARGPLMISSDNGNTKLALFTGEPPGGRRNIIGFRRVAFRVTGGDFLAFLGRLKDFSVLDESGKRVMAQDIVDHDKAFSIYFCDPYGHRLEVTTYDYGDVAISLSRK